MIKKRLMVLLAFLGLAVCSYGQIPTYTWSGNIGQKTYSEDAIIILKENATLNRKVTIKNGAHVKVMLGDDETRSLKITRSGGYYFVVDDVDSKLEIVGKSNARIVIDGGAVYETPGDARSRYISGGCGNSLIDCYGGLDMEYVDVINACKTGARSSGGAVYFRSRAGNTENVSSTFRHVRFIGCKASNGSALQIGNTDHHLDLTMQNCEIFYCCTPVDHDAYGGTIRTTGKTACAGVFSSCEIHHNSCYVDGAEAARGGAFYWNAAKSIGGKKSFLRIDGNTKIYDNFATSEGGGVFIESELNLLSADIYNNESENGAGVFIATYNNGSENMVVPWDVNVSNEVSIHNNKATQKGGGIMLKVVGSVNIAPASGSDAYFKFALNGGKVYDNTAEEGAGVCLLDEAPDVYRNNQGVDITYYRSVGINYGEIKDNVSLGNGGAIFVEKSLSEDYENTGDLDFMVTGGLIAGNKSQNGNGGAFYISNTTSGKADVTISQASISVPTSIYGNSCKGNGGAIYLENGDVSISGGSINSNQASNGGFFYVNGGNVDIIGGSLYENIATSGNGGGFYVNEGNVQVKGGSLYGNESKKGNGGALFLHGGGFSYFNGSMYENYAAQNGGGLYIDNGSFFLDDTQSGNSVFIYGNQAEADGGAVYVNSGSLVLKGGRVGKTGSPNSANCGGGFYVNGGNTFIQGGQVQYNQAANGGGLFIATGCHLEMSDGSVRYNQATGNGGGIYMAGEMYVSGNSLVVTGNKVAGQTNNVYLPDNDHYIYVDNSADPSLFNLGFTVGGNVPVPVFRSGNPAVVQRISDLINSGGEGSVFDDTHLYMPFYTTMMIDDFNPEYLYLIRTWSSVVGSDVETDPAKFKSIDTPLKLAQYMVYVNGLNEQGSHLHTPGKLTADIDMSAYYWVPIGGREKPFEGVFEGNGHTVNGIRCVNVAGYSDFGLFGATKDADISNLFVVNFDVASETNDANIGAIAGEMQGGGILNSSGTGSLYIKGSNTNVGGLVGHADNIVLRNCMTSMEFDGGSKVGGLCGTVINSIVENSFANGLVNQVTGQAGGLASSTDANSVVANCYSRMEVDDVLNYASLVYSNGGTLTHCYAKTSDYTASGTGSNLGRYAATVTPYRYGQFADGASDNLVDGGESLLAKLNSWVGDKEGYSHWMRTSASPVNGDYPVLSFDNLQNTLDYVAVVATRDNTELRYTTSANTAIAESNAYGDEVTVYLYRSPKEEVITTDNTSRVKIYIKEDVAILQGDGNTLQNAYVGVTMDNSAGAIDWHMFSSPLEGAPMGVDYDGDSKEYAPWFEAGAPSGMPEYAFYDDDVRDGYFPSSTPYASYDYYTYLEPQYHWINFKRNSNSHWHQDGAHDKIIYTNEDCLERGKGYLLAIGSETYMQSHGKLRGGDVVKTLSYTEGLGRDVIGYNLIGNPYQSYLDFDKFASENGVESYVVLDDDLGGYVSYAPTSSKNSYPSKDGEVPALNGCIHMHQGFFVRSWEPGKTVTFTNEMRQTTPKAESHLRGAQKDYPLVNLVSTEENGVSEYLTMEFGRPEKGGAEKMKSLRNGTSLLYTTIGDEDYSIAFMTQGTSTVPVRFETTEEGTFTMRWNTQNGAFTYLHLVDNKTGVDIDCLDSDEYRFTAAPDDYKSRFKLVVSYEDMEQEEMSTGEVFAFMMDGNLVVNGSGVLEVIDLQGRVMQTERLAGVQSVVSLPASAQGLYLLRMTGTEGTKVQKIVVR